MANRTFSAGTAFLTVVPSFRGIEDAFKAQVRDMARAADKDLAAGMARGLREANRQAKGTGAKAGQDYAGAYEAEAKKILTAAWRALPEPKPGVDLRKWGRALAQIRAEMKDLSEQRIGIDIDRGSFDRAVSEFQRRLEALRDTSIGRNREVGWFDANQAAGLLGELQKFSDNVQRQASDTGDQAGSAFVQRMRKAIDDGLKAVPPIRITADSSDAEHRLDAVRQRMLDLQSRQIGVDIDAAEAYAQLKAIHFELQRLDRTKVRVDVRTNAHDAASGMAGFIQQAEQAGRSTESIGHRATFSMSRLEYLIALGASLGTAIVPAALAAAGAIGMIGTSALGAVAGIGVLALGTSGVADAVKALNGYEQDRAKSANNLNQAQRRLAGSADQIRMAEMSLANTRRNIADQAQDAARRVADAEQGVADARRQARVDLVDAGRAVRDAQRAVTDAEADARDVRRQLNEAIREATRDMAELDTALARNNQEQEKAITAQMAALEELNRLKENPRATEVELRRAQDAYNEQTVRLRELRNDQRELADEKARADKLGVEGDERVIAARRRVADADERVTRAQERLAREQEDRREAEYRAQRRIADAQRAVADAQRQQARQASDGQFQLAQASNAVEQAQRSQAQAWEQSGVAGGAALEKLNEEMGQLSPAGQRFARFLFSLKDEMLGLRAAAAEPLLPRLEEAIRLLLPYLPALEDFVGRVATKMGDLAIASAEALGSPVWQRFFGYINQTAVPSLQTMFEVGTNLTEGLISLFLALTPFNGQVGSGLVELSRDFAEWAERLNKTRGYQEFLRYINENGPRVVHFLGEFGLLFIRLVEAAAPLGEAVLKGLTLLVEALNSIPTGALTALVIGIGAVSLGMTALGGVMRAIKFKQQMVDIFGPSAQRMIQTYAIDTGRATQETSRFGRTTATVAGMASAASQRMTALGTSVGALGGRLQAATTGATPLGSALDRIRLAALNASVALNGPAGVAGAAQAAGQRVTALGTSANAAAVGGMARARLAAFEVAAAANGPGGLAAGATAAARKVRELGTAATGAASSLNNRLVPGLGSAMDFLGGPWGLALAAATVALGSFAAESAKQKARVDALSTALAALSGEYRDLALVGKQAGAEAENTFRQIVRNNPEMQRAVIELDRLGISFETMMKAAASGDPSAVVAALNKEMDRYRTLINEAGPMGDKESDRNFKRLKELEAIRDAFVRNAKAIGLTSNAMEVLNASDERGLAIAAIKKATAERGADVQMRLVAAYDANAARIQVLNGVVAAFSNKEGTAASKADAMRMAIEQQTGAVVTAVEADEQFAQKLLALRDQVDASKAAHDRHATSMDLNSQTALRNRDAVEDVARAARDLYLQDIAAGVPMDQVTKKHGERIASLREEANRLGLTSAETKRLIKLYGEIDPNVTTLYETKGFDKVYKELRELQFAQMMLKSGASPEDAAAAWKKAESVRKGLYPQGSGSAGLPARRATGGPVFGPGTETSDSIPALLSNDEHVWTAAEVRGAGGHERVERLRKAALARRLPVYATGGPVLDEPVQRFASGGRVLAPYTVDVSRAWRPTMAQALAMAGGEGFAGLSPDASVRRIQQWALAQRGKRYLWAAVGPDRYDCSGLVGNLWAMATGNSLYRRYMSTGDMGPGRHGMVSGPGKHMTIYLGPGHTAANVGGLHVEAYGGNGVPLAIGRVGTPLSYYSQRLHLPGFAEGGPVDPRLLRTKRDRMVSFLRYGWPEPPHGGGYADLSRSPLVPKIFDGGGWLTPDTVGLSRLQEPEPVLTPRQWKAIEGFVAQGMAGGGGRETTYNFEFGDSTLTEDRLRAIQQRDRALAAIERVDRDNW